MWREMGLTCWPGQADKSCSVRLQRQHAKQIVGPLAEMLCSPSSGDGRGSERPAVPACPQTQGGATNARKAVRRLPQSPS